MRGGGAAWVLAPHDIERLSALLHTFLGDTRARCALLVDRAGHLLTAAGDTDFDGVAFASLAAADFAASGQLAQLLGEKEFAALYHQGKHGSMFMADVAGRAILATLFDDRTTLGMVRLHARTAVPQIGAVFAAAHSAGPAHGPAFAAGWLGEAEDEIDRLFRD